MAVLMIAKFSGDPKQLKSAYDAADAALLAQTGSSVPPGVFRHTCAVSGDALYIVDVWESEEAARSIVESDQFDEVLRSAGFPSPKEAEIEFLDVHAVQPPL
jgi:hypothetical protein